MTDQSQVIIPRFAPRLQFGRALEPAGLLHGAGQDAEAFDRYSQSVGSNRMPALYMAYAGVSQSLSKHVQSRLNRMSDCYPESTALQLGLAMTHDNRPELCYTDRVIAGEFDEALHQAARVLAEAGRDVYIRLGYEFNGHWNGYEPEEFIQAWRHVAEILRGPQNPRLALVWCWAPEDLSRPFMDYYPGDDWVDWWGLDPFDVEHFSLRETDAFLMEAVSRGFPVMAGESTPRRVGVRDGIESWQRWFSPCSQFLAKRPVVKAFCYISWDWAACPKWSDWGDGRIWENEFVLHHWQQLLDDPCWVHASP